MSPVLEMRKRNLKRSHMTCQNHKTSKRRRWDLNPRSPSHTWGLNLNTFVFIIIKWVRVFTCIIPLNAPSIIPSGGYFHLCLLKTDICPNNQSHLTSEPMASAVGPTVYQRSTAQIQFLFLPPFLHPPKKGDYILSPENINSFYGDQMRFNVKELWKV